MITKNKDNQLFVSIDCEIHKFNITNNIHRFSVTEAIITFCYKLNAIKIGFLHQ